MFWPWWENRVTRHVNDLQVGFIPCFPVIWSFAPRFRNLPLSDYSHWEGGGDGVERMLQGHCTHSTGSSELSQITLLSLVLCNVLQIKSVFLKVCGFLQGMPEGTCCFFQDGRLVSRNNALLAGIACHGYVRVLGGKGGFGSMLRAIGAQIEKTTSREACRDLSGRRIRDINNEKKLVATSFSLCCSFFHLTVHWGTHCAIAAPNWASRCKVIVLHCYFLHYVENFLDVLRLWDGRMFLWYDRRLSQVCFPSTIFAKKFSWHFVEVSY